MFRVLKKIRISWPLIVLGVFYAYLGFHALSGNQGALKWAVYAEKIEKLENEVSVSEKRRTTLERRAQQLRAQNLDLDRLDEEARRQLNVSHTNEYVIWLDDTP